MLTPYIPLLFTLAIVVITAIAMFGLSHGLSRLLGTRRKTATKLAPYESGMPVLGDARERFSVKFYLVAMLFILFDIETVFMVPWGVAFHQMTAARLFLLVEMLVFVLILAVGYIYVWKRGALQWD
ncbi:MAG TPA: NADH-quinone oxidoreductase subunit A [Gemmatimonadales bacterium]|nr:NADH-quinone oxidoreductase subunit A [Gemmatimonadales bacterium]